MTSFNEENFEGFNKNDSTQETKPHKEENASQNLLTSPRNRRRATHVFFDFQQSHLGINYSKPSIEFENKENIFIIYTCNLLHSTSSFGNKPLMALNWSSKSRKCHRLSSKLWSKWKNHMNIFFCKIILPQRLFPTIYQF